MVKKVRKNTPPATTAILTGTKRYDTLAVKQESKPDKAKAIDRFIHTVKSRQDLLSESDSHLWLTTVENVTIKADGKMLFRFLAGQKYPVKTTLQDGRISECPVSCRFFFLSGRNYV